VERFGWRHIDQPNHDVGYIQYPSVGARCADGNRDGDLDHRFDEIGYVADQGQSSAAVTMTSIAAANCGDCLQRRADCVRRNQSVYVECQPDNATPGIEFETAARG